MILIAEKVVRLTPRESETLACLLRGKTYWQIGKAMGISRHGVDKHMRSLREKFGAATSIQVVVEAFRNGLM